MIVNSPSRSLRVSAASPLFLGLGIGLAIAGVVRLPLARAAQPEQAPVSASATSGAAAAKAERAARFATCDVYKIAERLMKQDKYSASIKNAKAEAEARLEPMAKELEALRNKINAAGGPKADPEGTQLYQQKQQAIVQAQSTAEREFDRFTSQTNHAAYLAVIDAAQIVATARGYTHVLATRPADSGSGPETALQFTLGVLARPAVIFPTDDDLTEAVMAELKLE